VLYLLRVQRERMHRAFFPSSREYGRFWGVNGARLAKLPEHAIVMHPGPMNRGLEISGDVADSERAVITDQVTNGIAVRMACLYLLLGGRPSAVEPTASEAGAADEEDGA
jgi:aspartate carbamoyltransferase catalytic subunit